MPDARTVDADRLHALLRPRHPDVEVTGVRVLGAHDGSASRLRLAVDYAPGRDGGLPPTMFLKRNLPRFEFPAEMYSTEVRLYRDLLSSMAIEHPAVYAVEADATELEFTILMEDIGGRPGARLGVATEPATPDEVASLLTTLASMHGAWWGGARLDAEVPWLTDPTRNAPMQFWREIGPRLTHRHLESGHRAELVDAARWPEPELWPAFDRLVASNATGPHTLLHGDVHAGNVYYVAGGDGGLLDWQLMLRGSWALDVTYILVTALTPDDRRTYEVALLRHYLDELGRDGVDRPTWADAWLRYRQNVLYGVAMWLITPNGVHTDEVQDVNLQRCLTAGEDLETLAALRA
jgi:aminoglycoside phosphotransferase (APT) family kinase protein